MSSYDPLHALKLLEGETYYYALESLEKEGVNLHALPFSIRILLESLLRNCDEKRIKASDVMRLAQWNGKAGQQGEVPFIVSRVLLQDFTGVPLLVDLAAMRDAARDQGAAESLVEPLVPVDLVVDHSVQVDRAGREDAYAFNLKIEFERNRERYAFLKWGEQAFRTFKVIPPGIGIVHQANLEYLATLIVERPCPEGRVLYPDTLVGTDSHTTMINGLGIVGWGVGGIEAQAAMLGQPVTLPMPEVIGVHVTGRLREGVTATDLALRVTELLRKEGVVDKFVEFFGEGVSSLNVADRATVANMAPEYGATMGLFPIDDNTLDYLRMTGRSEAQVAQIRAYFMAQRLFGGVKRGEVRFTREIELSLDAISPSVAGPKRPQDRLSLRELKPTFAKLLAEAPARGGYGKTSEELRVRVPCHTEGTFSEQRPHDSGGSDKEPAKGALWSETEMVSNRPFTEPHVNPGYCEGPTDGLLGHGSIVIAAITSCTNTSNPSVMLAAGLLAKRAVERGLRVSPLIKTSLAPGSRVVTEYLKSAGLQRYLDALGFQLVGYGCTTCIGNSGPLDEKIEKLLKEHDLIAASVLSGNRNFEARIHSSVKANFLMSPPLVVAFALAGRIDIDLEREPLGHDSKGTPVFLKELWPSSAEVDALISEHLKPQFFKERYAHISQDAPLWKAIVVSQDSHYKWDKDSTYIQKPPYFEGFSKNLPKHLELSGMRALALFGDSVTTDHISPAGAFREESPAGSYLRSLGVKREDFNSYGSRRGNHQVMMRGTFANVRIKNRLAQGREGGFTTLHPEGEVTTIFEAAERYRERGVPLILFAGRDYGMGSSRDWAAKGTLLLGVRAVVAESFERIHRSNLVGMGVLPLQFLEGESAEGLGLTGGEIFSLLGEVAPRQRMELKIEHPDGTSRTVSLLIRIETPMEHEYFRHGGIMPYVLRMLLK